MQPRIQESRVVVVRLHLDAHLAHLRVPFHRSRPHALLQPAAASSSQVLTEKGLRFETMNTSNVGILVIRTKALG